MDIFSNPNTTLHDLFYFIQSKKSIDLETKRKGIHLIQKEPKIETILDIYRLAILDFLKGKGLEMVEMIQFCYPDLLYCQVKGQDQPLFEVVMKGMSTKELNKMLDILQLQKYQVGMIRDFHPKSIQVYFDYYFPLIRQENSNSKPSVDFVIKVVQGMLKNADRVSHPDYKLPVVKINVFTSLLNYVFLDHPSDKAMKNVYIGVKYLLFTPQNNCILTNHPSVLFTTFMGPLGQALDNNIKTELLDILGLLIASKKDVSDLLLKQWIAKYEEYTTESAVLVQYLLQSRQQDRTFFGLWSSNRWKQV
jgi:hypothetical protein